MFDGVLCSESKVTIEGDMKEVQVDDEELSDKVLSLSH